VPDKDLKALVRIIINYNIVSKLAVHLLHSYKPLKPSEIKLENKLTAVPGKWMRPVPIASLDPISLYSLAFKVKLKGGKDKTFYLILYKFTQGKSLVTKDNKEALGYIIQLANTII
jgi:hypothetical protein